MMRTRRLKMLLWLTSAGLLLLAGGVIGLHDAVPPTIAMPDPSSSDAFALEHAQPVSELIDSSVDRPALKRVGSRDLRQRLFDPPVVVPKPPPPKPLPRVELISTILRNGGDASAWVREGQVTRKVATGDTVGTEPNTATVIAIKADRIILDHESGEAEVLRDSATSGSGRR